jgi:hypothetical protein
MQSRPFIFKPARRMNVFSWPVRVCHRSGSGRLRPFAVLVLPVKVVIGALACHFGTAQIVPKGMQRTERPARTESSLRLLWSVKRPTEDYVRTVPGFVSVKWPILLRSVPVCGPDDTGFPPALAAPLPADNAARHALRSAHRFVERFQARCRRLYR